MRLFLSLTATLTLASVGLSGCQQKDAEPEIADSAQALGEGNPGEGLYQKHCAACHDGGTAEAPTKAAIQLNGVESIRASLTTGTMKEQASMMTPIEIRIIADYLASPSSESALANAKKHQCKGQLKLSKPLWNRWGNSKRNVRFQPAVNAGITAAEAPNMKLKWAFGFPGSARARSPRKPYLQGARADYFMRWIPRQAVSGGHLKPRQRFVTHRPYRPIKMVMRRRSISGMSMPMSMLSMPKMES